MEGSGPDQNEECPDQTRFSEHQERLVAGELNTLWLLTTE